MFFILVANVLLTMSELIVSTHKLVRCWRTHSSQHYHGNSNGFLLPIGNTIREEQIISDLRLKYKEGNYCK